MKLIVKLDFLVKTNITKDLTDDENVTSPKCIIWNFSEVVFSHGKIDCLNSIALGTNIQF